MTARNYHESHDTSAEVGGPYEEVAAEVCRSRVTVLWRAVGLSWQLWPRKKYPECERVVLTKAEGPLSCFSFFSYYLT